VIVGGGFSGVAVACALLRQARSPLCVQLVERGAEVGRGLAYGTTDPTYLLNVPAGRMGLQPDDEAGFARYLAGRGLPWGAADFAPRALYGSYLQTELARQAHSAASGVQLVQVQGEVVACHEHRVDLADGRSLHAGRLVLATGAWPLAWPGATRAGSHLAGWIDDPWRPGALAGIGRDDAVLLLGSGLTALDMMASLQGRGHHGPVTMLSRRGLLPQAHRGLGAAPPALAETAAALGGLQGLRQQLRAFRQRVAVAAQAGHDWRDLLTGLREVTPALWQALSAAERARFLRHLQPFWDTHRHRAAPPVRAAADAALQAGRLQLSAGRVLGVQAVASGGCVLQVRHRADGQVRPLAARWVVNCTGAGPVPRNSQDRLWQGLLQGGQVRVDAQGLGIEVDASHRLIAADGRVQPHWFYIGPLLRAQHWEATAVIELRRHAHELAASLLKTG
jgi:uncharacterized NAD(P)/FAD-binding protein YdhS